MPVPPANTPFPAPLQVGQGATPAELNIDQPIKSSQGTRFRDRDEYLRSIVSDGALAVEDIAVKNATVNGTLHVTAAAHLLSTLEVDGLSTFDGDADFNGTADFFGVVTFYSSFNTPETPLIYAGL